MASRNILYVDDDPESGEIVRRLLSGGDYDVSVSNSGKDALKKILNAKFDLVLTDLNMPGLSGLELLEKIKDKDPDLLVIILTAYATIDTAVKAIKLGAENYITKPITRDETLLILDKAFEKKRLIEENFRLQAELSHKYSYDNIIGVSSEMQKVYSMIYKASKYQSNVIIYGETGTGKELVAKAIHYSSDRKNGPLIIINCASIPENLLESELYGHSKGAFTGATFEKIGLFETANKGSIFLDEIGEMSKSLQVKLLRVIEDREIRPLGDTKQREIDVRIIAATNKDLLKAIKSNEFRSDLFFRLNVFPIYLPRLKGRVGDIPLLIDHFLKMHRNEGKPSGKKFSANAIKSLLSYEWPGNVRELKNLILRCIILSNMRVISDHELQSYINIESDTDEKYSLTSLDIVEKDHITRVLHKVYWNRSKASKILGIQRKTLYEKMRRYEIS